MKAVIPVPDDVFEEAERLAKKTKKSRSELYSRALREFVARHAEDRVTLTLDEVVAAVDETPDEFAPEAGRRSLKRAAW